MVGQFSGHRSGHVVHARSSLPNDASVLLNAVGSHWSIENQLHWSLEVTFNEDRFRVRSGNGAESFSVLRRMALNLLKAEESTKRSLAGKRKDAAWDNNYLLNVLLKVLAE